MTDPNIFDNPGQRFVDLTSDIGFHFVFGDENNKEVVIRLINILLGDEHHVVDIEYMNNEQLGEAMTSKGVRFDLHCMDTE